MSLFLLIQEEKLDEKAESRHIRGGWTSVLLTVLVCVCVSRPDESGTPFGDSYLICSDKFLCSSFIILW